MKLIEGKSSQSPAPEQAPPVRTNDRPARITGLLILLIAFGVFGGWSAMAKLDSAAVAPGVVTVESYRKTIQHLEGGIVEEILVRDGTVVQPGDVLLRLDDTQADAQLEIARSQYFAALGLQARLVAEREQHEKIVFPGTLLTRRADPRVQETMASQRQVFETRRTSLEGEIALLKQRSEQLEEQIRGLEALQASKMERIKSYREEIKDLRKLFEQRLGDKMRLRELERTAAELEGERAEHLSSIAQTRIRIGETRLQIIQLQKEFQKEVVAELRETQTQIFDLQERIHALEDTVTRTEIRALVSGVVVGMDVHTVGGVIAPGDRILDIVPQGERLIVEARVDPMDIDKVTPGLTADVRFTAFQVRSTPVVEGIVQTVSADRLTDPNTDLSYYLARIMVTKEGMQKLGSLELLPGMPADVMIKTGERTLLDYLLKPLTDGLARAFREE